MGLSLPKSNLIFLKKCLDKWVHFILYIDNEFYVIQILESFYVEIIIFPVIFDGQTPMFCRYGKHGHLLDAYL